MSGGHGYREELALLIGDCTAELERIRGMKGPTDRVDAYCALLRGVLVRSSLCTIGGEVHWWDGACFRPVSVGDLSCAVGNILADMGVGATDVRRIGVMPYGVLKEKVREPSRGLIGFVNGVYDMGTGELLPFSEERVVLWEMPYRCGPEERCPKWEGFLREVLPDGSERACLQEFFGMCFLDRARLSIEKMALLVGSGANGKSVVCEVMRGVIGPSRVSDLSPDQLMSDKMVSVLEGKALNFAPDVRRGAAFDSALKALASSQEVTGWRLYSGAVKVKCPPLAFALNEMPWFRDVTPAFFRRLLVFRFGVTIPPERQDRTLAATIVREESPGVFNWLMEGRRRLLANDGEFTRCPAMDRRLSELRRDVSGTGSPLRRWLAENGWSPEPGPDGRPAVRVGCSEILAGLGGSMSRNAITRELDALGVRRDRGRETRYWLYPVGRGEDMC